MYGNYGYFVDNTKNLCCLDLNTLKMVWTRVLGDDSDVTPVIDEEDGVPYIYIGTEVDNQGGTGKYSGAAYIYKVNVDFYDTDGNAYIVICDSIGQVHLVNAQTGERIKYIQTAKNLGTPEKTSSGINIEASPIVYNGMMVVGTTTGSIFGITIE